MNKRYSIKWDVTIAVLVEDPDAKPSAFTQTDPSWLPVTEHSWKQQLHGALFEDFPSNHSDAIESLVEELRTGLPPIFEVGDVFADRLGPDAIRESHDRDERLTKKVDEYWSKERSAKRALSSLLKEEDEKA